MVFAPFAEYRLVAVPRTWKVRMPDGDRVILTDRCGQRVVCARVNSELIYVEIGEEGFLGWGGRRNHGLQFADGNWTFTHYRHDGAILINGEECSDLHVLRSGDVVTPATGLDLQYVVRDDIETLAAGLSPAFTTTAFLPEVRGEPLVDWILEKTCWTLDDALVAARHLRARFGSSV